jgi:hypothetical protein
MNCCCYTVSGNLLKELDKLRNIVDLRQGAVSISMESIFIIGVPKDNTSLIKQLAA